MISNLGIDNKSGWIAGFVVFSICLLPGVASGQGGPLGVGQFLGPPASGSFLGVGVKEVDAEVAEEKELPEVRGVEITNVVEGSAAEEGGLRIGDVVLEYNEYRIEGVEQFKRLVRETPVGRDVAITVVRNGSTHTLNATMGPYPRRGFHWFSEAPHIEARTLLPHPMPDIPRVFTTWKSSHVGIEAESLEPQLAKYFGVEEGVLVRAVVQGSPADKAGMHAGDVIVQVAGTKVTRPRDITNAIRKQDSETVSMTIVRERQEMTVDVTLPESRERRHGDTLRFWGPTSQQETRL